MRTSADLKFSFPNLEIAYTSNMNPGNKVLDPKSSFIYKISDPTTYL